MRSTSYPPLRLGWSVYGADGERIGEIAGTRDDHFLVEKGFMFTTDRCIPLSAVASVDEDGRVTLFLTKDEAERQDWSSPPVLHVDYGAARTTGATAEAPVSGYVDPAIKVIERSREQKRSRRAE